MLMFAGLLICSVYLFCVNRINTHTTHLLFFPQLLAISMNTIKQTHTYTHTSIDFISMPINSIINYVFYVHSHFVLLSSFVYLFGVFFFSFRSHTSRSSRNHNQNAFFLMLFWNEHEHVYKLTTWFYRLGKKNNKMKKKKKIWRKVGIVSFSVGLWRKSNLSSIFVDKVMGIFCLFIFFFVVEKRTTILYRYASERKQ